MKYFPRVLRYLVPYRWLAVASVLLIVAGSLAGLLSPWPLQILVDYVLQNRPIPGILGRLTTGLSQVTLLVLAVAGSFLVTVLVHGLAVFTQYVNTKLNTRMALDFRSDLLEHAHKLSLAFHDKTRTGHLIFAINSQGEAVSQLIMTVPPIAQSLITLVGMLWICWSMDWQLTLLALSVAPPLYLSTSFYMKHIHARLVAVRNMEGEALAIVHETVTMMRVIVAFGRESVEQKRFREQGLKATDARVDVTVRQAVFALVVAAMTGLGSAVVLGVGFLHVLRGQITVGQMLVLLTYVSMVYQPLSTISRTVGSLQEVFVNLEIAFNLLDITPEVTDSPKAVPMKAAAGHVEFRDVHFSYEGRRETLDGISFRAQSGQVIGIVGQTGAGKTTLVSLIPRFYDVREGSVMVDGVDVRDVTLKSLRLQISMVLQEPLLFSGTIAGNIRYGRQDADTEEVIAAAKAANAHDFINALPDGYETMLGERGAKLSGGERQRLSIARAFLKNAPILILDEPTSSVDTRTENVILDALDKLMAGRTTFIIAHRLSTIRRADLVLVVAHGRIVEYGHPEQLLQRSGPYRKLYDAQMGVAAIHQTVAVVDEAQSA